MNHKCINCAHFNHLTLICVGCEQIDNYFCTLTKGNTIFHNSLDAKQVYQFNKCKDYWRK